MNNNKFIKKVKEYKEIIKKTEYTDTPKLSVILLSFNHIDNIDNTFNSYA